MDANLMIMGAAFIGVLAFVFGIGHLFQGNSDTQLEARLAAFTGRAVGPSRKEITDSLVRDGMQTANGFMAAVIGRFQKLPLLFRQADSPVKIEHFLGVCGGTAALGAILTVIARAPGPLIPWAELWASFCHSCGCC